MADWMAGGLHMQVDGKIKLTPGINTIMKPVYRILLFEKVIDPFLCPVLVAQGDGRNGTPSEWETASSR